MTKSVFVTAISLVFVSTVYAVEPADGPQMLADQLMNADERQFVAIFPKLQATGEKGAALLASEVERKLPLDAAEDAKEKLAKRQANAAVALLKLGQPDKVWPLLKHSPDPRVRSYLLHRLGPLGVDAGAIIKRLDEEPDATICRALLLSLGEYGENKLLPEHVDALIPKLTKIYRDDPDPGLHAAVEWLLRTLNPEHANSVSAVNEDWVKKQERQLGWSEPVAANVPDQPLQKWYVTSRGETMVVIPGPAEFMMGSPVTEAGRVGDEPQHKKRIGRTFAMSAKPVTLEQYRLFDKDFELTEHFPKIPGLPVVLLSWFDAAAYCNWLSQKEGIPEDQWCFEPNLEKDRGPLKLKENYLHLSGYRMPTVAEMEYATRAGAATSRYFGETEELLPKYAWYKQNSEGHSWPVGRLKPNDLGLFDMHGNASTWCLEWWKSYPQGSAVSDDTEDGNRHFFRELRGGGFGFKASEVRSAARLGMVMSNHPIFVGLRLARTLPPATSAK